MLLTGKQPVLQDDLDLEADSSRRQALETGKCGLQVQGNEPIGDDDREPLAQPLSLAFSDNDEVWVPGGAETQVTRTPPAGQAEPSSPARLSHTPPPMAGQAKASPPASPSETPDLSAGHGLASAPGSPAGLHAPSSSQPPQALPASSPAETEDGLEQEDGDDVAGGQYTPRRSCTHQTTRQRKVAGLWN